MRQSSLAAMASLATITLAQRAIPSNIQSLYDSIKSAGCANFLQTSFYSEEGGPKDFGYCGDHLSSDGIIYLTGPAGKFANMDIDCDGQQHGAGDDGRCGSSSDTQDQTTWQDEAAQLSGGAISDLNAFVHDYVVFGNDDTDPSFDPRQYGVEPLSVMAVVCGDKMVYGIWGDTNGNDGPPLVGEASISLATLCFGDGVNGDSGHDADDVLYIAFTGKGAVPQSADWGAQSAADFESSIAGLGDALVGKIGSGGGNSTAPAGGDSGDSGKVGTVAMAVMTVLLVETMGLTVAMIAMVMTMAPIVMIMTAFRYIRFDVDAGNGNVACIEISNAYRQDAVRITIRLERQVTHHLYRIIIEQYIIRI